MIPKLGRPRSWLRVAILRSEAFRSELGRLANPSSTEVEREYPIGSTFSSSSAEEKKSD